MVVDTTLYDRLDVKPNSSDVEIKKSYRRLAMIYHPDKNKEPSAADRFKDIGEAYEIISDPEKRALYDLHGMDSLKAGGMPNPNDIFAQMFGGGFQHQQRRHAPPTQTERVKCTLEDIYMGADKDITFDTQKTCTSCIGSGTKNGAIFKSCEDCKGSGVRIMTHQIGPGMIQQSRGECGKCKGLGEIHNPTDCCEMCKGARVTDENRSMKITIPKGIHNDQGIALKGEGPDVPVREGKSKFITKGDLIVQIVEDKHDIYRRISGQLDLYATIKISLFDALTGVNVSLPFLDGTHLAFSIKNVVNPDDEFKIKGKGMPQVQRTSTGVKVIHGDLYIKFNIIFPTTLISSDKLKSVIPTTKYNVVHLDATMIDITLVSKQSIPEDTIGSDEENNRFNQQTAQPGQCQQQ